jgi:hypothetical protein
MDEPEESYLFTVEVVGRGTSEAEAWQDARESFNQHFQHPEKAEKLEEA